MSNRKKDTNTKTLTNISLQCSSIYGFPCIRIYFIKGGGYHCTGVRVADEPCRPAVQAKRKIERKKPPEAKVGLESS